jgi:hypothetical protein
MCVHVCARVGVCACVCVYVHARACLCVRVCWGTVDSACVCGGAHVHACVGAPMCVLCVRTILFLNLPFQIHGGLVSNIQNAQIPGALQPSTPEDNLSGFQRGEGQTELTSGVPPSTYQAMPHRIIIYIIILLLLLFILFISYIKMTYIIIYKCWFDVMRGDVVETHPRPGIPPAGPAVTASNVEARPSTAAAQKPAGAL